MSGIYNPGTVDFSFPTGSGNSVLIPVQADPLSLAAAASIDSKISAELSAGTITSYTYTGGDFTPPSGNTELIVNTGANAVLLTANISEVLINTNDFVTLSAFPTTAAQDVVAGTGGIDMYINGGTGTIIAAGGNNQITDVLGGNHTILLGGGGANSVEVDHGNSFISAGTGSNVIALGDGNNTVLSTGQDVIESTGLAAGGNDVIDASSNTNGDFVVTGDNNVTFINGSGATTFIGQGGSDTVFGGAGGGSYQGGSNGNNLLIGGTGAVTLAGGGSGDVLTLTVGSASNLVTAGAGNETLTGGLATGSNTFQAGSGNDLVIGGLGNDVLQAGTGNASIAGSLGNNTFEFVNGQAGGNDTLLDFTLSHGNKVDLSGYGANAVQNALSTAAVSGGNTTITLADNTTITFLNDTHLNATNFITT